MRTSSDINFRSNELFTVSWTWSSLKLNDPFTTEVSNRIREISGRLTLAIVNFPQFRNYPIIDSRFEGINEILAISFKMEAGFTRWKEFNGSCNINCRLKVYELTKIRIDKNRWISFRFRRTSKLSDGDKWWRGKFEVMKIEVIKIKVELRI